jgi:L-asparaginase II
VVLDGDGTVLAGAGDVEHPMLPRSCNKPIQALGMLEVGLPLTDELLALSCASHSGESFHVEGVRRILASVGLTEDALQTPPDWPLDDVTREELIRSGGAKSSIQMNCSGKHAAMLATCVTNGWPLESYLDVDHPLQQAIAATFARTTGEAVAHVAIDGCGAPLLSTSLTGLATAFSRLATGRGFETLSHRDELALLRAVPGAIGKAGAESCYVVALPDGRAFATKTDDGGVRARPVLMAALLDRFGVTAEPGVDADAVRRTGESVLLGGGRPVGEIRAVVAAG